MTFPLGPDSSKWEPNPPSSARTARSKSMPRAPLVLGFGNVLLGDDGAGIQMVERLRSDPALRGCAFIDGGTMSFSLLSYVEETDSMLIVDAAELNGVPGTVSLFEGTAMDGFLKSNRRRTVHEVGLIDLLDMARLRDSLPEQRALLCIQPGPIDWGPSLSPAVVGALGYAAREARALLDRWNVS